MSRLAQPPEMSWTIDQSINVDRISMEELKMIFNQAEKRLDDTVKQGEIIASRTMSLVTLMASLLIALAGYMISIWKDLSALTTRDFVAIVGCLYLLCLLIYIISNLMTYRYSAGGSMPEQLVNSTYEDDEIPRSKMLLLMYINEIEEYNSRIAHNSILNRHGWRRYRIGVGLFLSFPLVLALLYELLECFRRGK